MRIILTTPTCLVNTSLVQLTKIQKKNIILPLLATNFFLKLLSLFRIKAIVDRTSVIPFYVGFGLKKKNSNFGGGGGILNMQF